MLTGHTATFLWFSGKGGTGKTTLSTATALQLADRGHNVLLVSTDPAHSLSDSLDMEISGTTAVNDNLDAVEVDPEEEVEDYRAQLEASGNEGMGVMKEVYESMDIVKSGPGVAEMAALNRFMEFMNTDTYDVVVFDTAPTGHTLALLQLPEIMDSMVGKVLQMRLRFAQAIDTVKTLFGQGDQDTESDIQKLEQMKERIRRAREKMQDPNITSFNFVMIPEEMSVAETERAVEQVQEFNIPVGRLFVNQIVPENPDCQFCTARRNMQQDNLQRIKETFTDYTIVTIPLFSEEIHGIPALNTLADHMTPVTPQAN